MENDSPKKLKELRDQAEQLLSERPKDFKDIPVEDIQKLIHELKVYQIELEMQNDELLSTLAELERARNRYVDLYDFAPVGYVTVDQNLLTIEANLTGANLLGTERSGLMKKGLSHYVAEDYQHKYFSTVRQSFETKETQTCQLKIIKKNGAEFYAQLNCKAVQDEEGNVTQTSITITDITELKKSEEEVEKHREHLEELVEERTKELKKTINLMTGREVRMGELKKVIQKLRNQLESAGMTPVADDPLKIEGTGNEKCQM